MKKANLIPEWDCASSIALVWPEHLPTEVGSRLKAFYKSLIKQLSDEEIITTLLVRGHAKDRVHFQSMFDDRWVKLEPSPMVSDIWIRDFGPMFLKRKGKLIPVKFRYKPSYSYSQKEIHWAQNNDEVGKKLAAGSSEVKAGRDNLILDGGNFIHNGIGTAIVTNRIISDNEHLFESEIRDVLKTELGIEELYIVPSEPGDDTGHIDGLIRFLDPNTLVVSKYPDQYIPEADSIPEEDYDRSRNVTNKIATYFKEQGFTVLRLINSIPKKGKYKISCKCKGEKHFENATGNYMNFLRIGNKIFLPQYNNPVFDAGAYEFFMDYRDLTKQDMQIIKTLNDATKLAEYGGVLNCISLPLFDQIPTMSHFKNQFVVIAKEEAKNSELAQVEIVYLARKELEKISPKEYSFVDVVMIDFRNKSISDPNNLQSICKYREPSFLDSDKDDSDYLIEKVFELPTTELRKLWKLLYIKAL